MYVLMMLAVCDVFLSKPQVWFEGNDCRVALFVGNTQGEYPQTRMRRRRMENPNFPMKPMSHLACLVCSFVLRGGIFYAVTSSSLSRKWYNYEDFYTMEDER